MRTASFSRHQRLFGNRDWSPGEPNVIGDRTLGIVTPEGSVEFNRHARFTEPADAWLEPALDIDPVTPSPSRFGFADALAMAAIIALGFSAAVFALYLDAGM